MCLTLTGPVYLRPKGPHHLQEPLQLNWKSFSSFDPSAFESLWLATTEAGMR